MFTVKLQANSINELKRALSDLLESLGEPKRMPEGDWIADCSMVELTPAPQPTTVPTSVEPQYNIDMIRTALSPYLSNTEMLDGMRAIITSYGCETLDGIPKEKLGEVVERFRALGVRI